MSKKYNGFTNYETWIVNLWLNNDRDTYLQCREAARQALSDAADMDRVIEGDLTLRAVACIFLGGAIHRQVIAAHEPDPSFFFPGLLFHALSQVEWDEITEPFIEECLTPNDPTEPSELPATDSPKSELAPMSPNDTGDALPTESKLEPFGDAVGFWQPEDVIHVYTRSQAIADGVLVDAGLLAAEAGFRYPVALTSAAWQACVEVPMSDLIHDQQGRLWDVLNLLLVAIRSADAKTGWIDFCVDVADENENLTTVKLKSLCGPGDDAQPVITIMLPDED